MRHPFRAALAALLVPACVGSLAACATNTGTVLDDKRAQGAILGTLAGAAAVRGHRRQQARPRCAGRCGRGRARGCGHRALAREAPAGERPDPFVALLVSGGHTLLLDVSAWGHYRLLGETRDDAAGEAFDKVATLLGLGYPGGPAVERLAREGDPTRFVFPRPIRDEGLEFSFSGLKTAVLHAVRASPDAVRDRADLARGFQDAALDVLVTKLERAVRATGRRVAVLAGGVACSRTLAALAAERLRGVARVAVASPRLNADNAAMIARAGWWHTGARRAQRLDARRPRRSPHPGLEPRSSTPHAPRTGLSWPSTPS